MLSDLVYKITMPNGQPDITPDWKFSFVLDDGRTLITDKVLLIDDRYVFCDPLPPEGRSRSYRRVYEYWAKPLQRQSQASSESSYGAPPDLRAVALRNQTRLAGGWAEQIPVERINLTRIDFVTSGSCRPHLAGSTTSFSAGPAGCRRYAIQMSSYQNVWPNLQRCGACVHSYGARIVFGEHVVQKARSRRREARTTPWWSFAKGSYKLRERG